MRARALCSGSFDPVTCGHVDLFERAAAQFGELVVTVVVNPNKVTMFTVDERVAMVREVTAHIRNVRVMSWRGLLVDLAREQAVTVIVKGLRCGDFGYERSMAEMNRALTGVDTVFLAGDPAYGFVSSSMAKQVAAVGGELTGLLPLPVQHRLLKRLAEK